MYGLKLFYDIAEQVWEEFGVYHYSNRLNFSDFMNEIKKRIPNTWDDGLTERVKFIYFASKEKGNFPRWFSLPDDVKTEIKKRSDFDEKRKSMNVMRSRQDIEDRKIREIKAYDVDVIRRTKRKGEIISEHAISDEIKASMELLALQHCARERDSLAIQRYIEREKELNEKDKDEMKRLKEIIEADKLAY